MMKGGGDSNPMGKKNNGSSACRICERFSFTINPFTAGYIIEILSVNDEDEGDQGGCLDGGYK